MGFFAEKTIDTFLNNIRTEKENSQDSSYLESLVSLEKETNFLSEELKGDRINYIFSLAHDDFQNSNIVSSVERLKDEISNVSFSKESMDKDVLLNQISTISADLKIIKYLFDFSQFHRNIVICGSNGSGKSTFASFLKTSYLSNLIVLPAQKFLYYVDIPQNQNKKISDFQKMEDQDVLKLAQATVPYDQNNPENVDFRLSQDLIHRFTLSITSLVHDHVRIALADRQDGAGHKTPTFFEKAQLIWNKLFPNLQLITDDNSVVLRVKDIGSDTDFSINGMSDGERSCLYYLACVMTAPADSFIVVDEPETYLNPAIYNKLWDMLVNERNDCQFIFISHNKDFIASRSNSSILWIKKYTRPDKWGLEEIESQDDMPIDLLVSLVGSRKDILFCEGESGSWDNKVYSQLFIDDKTVIPVGGHDQVIQYTQSVNTLSGKLNMRAVGIVDGDGKDEAEVTRLKKENVFVMPFNEIEMLFLSEEMVHNVLQYFNLEKRFVGFRNKFFETISQNRESIVLNILADRLNYFLSSRDISDRTSIDSIKESAKKINACTNKIIDSDYEKLKNKIDNIVQDEDYAEALQMCNLKGQITKGIANYELDRDYVNKALARIEKDNELRLQIIKKYFSGIKSK
ncbi:AAA family ATPase [Oenococcus oeni]|uniref:AAA family ATPase n=1 Tax=Oenococcus oeni TaxID=1247 RepID=UPI0008F8B3A4|nr:AAA family ATPase [Oenococcus oeni]OIM08168.1 ABC transporter ATP-binding protein [Oenococcus oeni]